MFLPSFVTSWGYHTIFPPTKMQDKADSPPHPSNADINDADDNDADNADNDAAMQTMDNNNADNNDAAQTTMQTTIPQRRQQCS
jgi:hypothetical protein